MNNEKVLIVEDEENERTGLAELVSSWGYSAETARDGQEGHEKVLAWSPSIVITDLKMPRLSGLELLEIPSGWPVARLLGQKSGLAGLIEIPFSGIAITESDLATNDGARTRGFVHVDEHPTGSGGWRRRGRCNGGGLAARWRALERGATWFGWLYILRRELQIIYQ